MRQAKSACLMVVLLLTVALIAGCVKPAQTATVSSTPAPSITSPSTLTALPSPGSTPTTASSSPANDDWPTYHRDSVRSGFDPGMSIGGPLQQVWTTVSLDGDIYAEPLVVGQMVLAATEQNSVYSIDIQTGKILWQMNLGTPVPLSELSCGNIDPSGITSTPVADPAARTLYVVARIQPNHHELFVLNLDTGAIISHQTVDPSGSDPRVQQQRSALALANGRVYISFGGLAGDCGTYYGWLVGAAVNGTDPLITYRVSSHIGAALWAPSGPAVDSAGNIYVTSGNVDSGSTFDYGNAVLRLSPDITLKDWFAPTNWQQLDNGDTDLGSMGPTLLQESLIFQAGKEGKGYLLDANNLGNISEGIFSADIGGGAYGGTAYAPPYVFVPCADGLKALQIQSGPTFQVAWSSPSFNAGPPVVAGGTVLTIDRGSGTLYGFDVNNGNSIFKMQIGKVMNFTTPTLSGGNVFVAANRQIIRLSP